MCLTHSFDWTLFILDTNNFTKYNIFSLFLNLPFHCPVLYVTKAFVAKYLFNSMANRYHALFSVMSN